MNYFFQKYFQKVKNGQKKCPKSDRAAKNPEKKNL